MNKWKITAAAGGAALIIVLSFLFDLPAVMVRGLSYINSLGAAGAVIFIAMYIAATVAFLPGSILTLGAGFVFGLGMGTVYTSIASTLGAGAAFLMGRTLFRGWVSAKIAGNEKFSAIDQAVAAEGWKIVFLTRLSPVFPFNVLNYAYGLTNINFKDYFFSSWIGMLPGTLMYVYIGSMAGDVAAFAYGSPPGAGAAAGGAVSGQVWFVTAMRAAGLAATILVTVLITRIARKALKKHIKG